MTVNQVDSHLCKERRLIHIFTGMKPLVYRDEPLVFECLPKPVVQGQGEKSPKKFYPQSTICMSLVANPLGVQGFPKVAASETVRSKEHGAKSICCCCVDFEPCCSFEGWTEDGIHGTRENREMQQKCKSSSIRIPRAMREHFGDILE